MRFFRVDLLRNTQSRSIAIWLLVWSLTARASTACDCVDSPIGGTCYATSATRVSGNTSISWSFKCGDQPCECGQYVNGDFWVSFGTPNGDRSEGVTIVDVSPTGEVNGLEQDPRSPSVHGLLSCAKGYDRSINLMNELPYRVPQDSSLIKAVRRTGQCGSRTIRKCCVATYDVLTILKAPPREYSRFLFRPGFASTSKESFSTSDFDLRRLPRIPQISASGLRSRFDRITKRWSTPYFDHMIESLGDKGRAFAPADILDDYGAAQASMYLNDLLTVMGSDADEKKKSAVYALIQRGIDLLASWESGIRWRAGAGQKMGRKPPIAFAAALSTRRDVRELVAGIASGRTPGSTRFDFQEDGQIRGKFEGFAEPIWGDTGGYCQENWYWSQLFLEQQYSGGSRKRIGPGDNKRTCGDPYGFIDGPAGKPGSAYQTCCSSAGFVAYALAQWLMPDLRATASDPDLLRYADRVRGGSEENSSGGAWTLPDPCAPPDPREAADCRPHLGGHGCLFYGRTWGPRQGGKGCIEHAGTRAGSGRFPHRHRKEIKLSHQSALSRELWSELRSCAETCSCLGQEHLCNEQIQDRSTSR